MAFIVAYSKETGAQQRIPEHWLDNPVLGKGFRKTPPPKGAAVRTRGEDRQSSGDINSPTSGDHEGESK